MCNVKKALLPKIAVNTGIRHLKLEVENRIILLPERIEEARVCFGHMTMTAKITR